MPHFVNLRTYSDYSLGKSILRVKEIVKAAKMFGQPAIALTDINTMFGALEFASEAIKSGIQPINGIDLTIKHDDGTIGNIIVLATNENGYTNLSKLTSRYFQNQHAVDIDFLSKHSDGIIALIANNQNSYEFNTFKDGNYLDTTQIEKMRSIFDTRLFIEVIRYPNQSLIYDSYETKILDYAYQAAIPIVATNPTTFIEDEKFEALQALECIVEAKYLTDSDYEDLRKYHKLRSKEEMVSLFADIPEAIVNTEIIAKKCHFASPIRDPLLPQFTDNEEKVITDLATEGLKKRISTLKYSVNENEYFERLDFELSVILKMRYAGYFLIVSDFIKWSKSQNIPVGPGRGSGVGSIVAWSLEITDLDPIKFGLLFERFLNPERVSMPDFDIDFCQRRRSEVIDYVKHKYGADKVAQIITFGKLQARAALRDVGRVLHFPYKMVDKICKMVPVNPANPITLAEAINLDKELQYQRDSDQEIARLLKIALELEGVCRHASKHAAGIVIADRDVTDLIPIYKEDDTDQESDMPAVQFSMKYAEMAGLIKFDFLGLQTLTLVSETLKLLSAKGIEIDISNLTFDDPKTYELLSSGDTVGVFQFESAGMKEAIKRLKPDSIGDLIALGSLYRPGPMDNIPSYIKRKHGQETPTHLHPKMGEILKETYGIIVYQEQVIEIARVLCGYSLVQGDLLRRAMGKKIKAEMEAQRANFIKGCIANDIEEAIADEIFSFIEKFASYGFNKSHAAAYAVISYQTAYLKANYPLEFFVASINLEIDDSDKINGFVNEAKKFGITVLPPDLNKSESMFTIEDDAIRFGLAGIKNVSITTCNKIVNSRKSLGAFNDLTDFITNISHKDINRKALENLIKAGALKSLYSNSATLLHNLEYLIHKISENDNTTTQIGLFDDLSSPIVLDERSEWSLKELIAAEFEGLGFYLTHHPVEIYSDKLKKLRTRNLNEIVPLLHGKSQKFSIAGAVASIKVRSSKRGKFAFLQLTDTSGLLEVSIFNEELLNRNAQLLSVGNTIFAKIDGKIDHTGARIIIEDLQDIATLSETVFGKYKLITTSKDILIELQRLFQEKGHYIELYFQHQDGHLLKKKKKNFDFYLSEESLNSFRSSKSCEIHEL